MFSRILFPAAIIAGALFSGISYAEPPPPAQAPDPVIMDKVMNQAMREGLMAHRIGRRHVHRWYRRTPRSSVVIYYSNTPRYRNYYVGNGYQAAKRRCDRRYRSYNWRTDRFTTYSGKKKLCPYVRPYY